jgi:rhamnosyltransferase
MTPKHAALIVCYLPDAESLNCIEQMIGLFPCVCIVDNSPALNADLARIIHQHPDLTLIARPENCGIATALNIGMTQLNTQQIEYVFLYDQDSRPDLGMIERQLALHGQMQDTQVAQISPAYFDLRLNRLAPFIKVGKTRIHRVPATGSAPILVDYLITSGACVSMRAWHKVGAFDERLFIDCVDIEWGLRATAAGWLSYGDPSIVMRHRLGDEPIKILGRQYPAHSPLRHYYFIRNTLLLLGMKHVPWVWKCTEIKKIPIRLAAYTFYSHQQRARHCKMMLLGIWHAIRGRSGKL